MPRPRHSYRRQARLQSQIRHDRAALLALRIEDTRLQTTIRAQKHTENARYAQARAEYADIIAAYIKCDPNDQSPRWDIHNSALIEHRRMQGLPPIGWDEENQMPVHYPDWMDYDLVYGRLSDEDMDAIREKAKAEVRRATAAV